MIYIFKNDLGEIKIETFSSDFFMLEIGDYFSLDNMNYKLIGITEAQGL